MTEDEEREMRRDLLRDVADAAHQAQAKLAANHALEWVRGPNDDKRTTDEFGGCVE